MSKLKNPTLNSISVWVHHSRIITLRKEISCLSIFLAWLAWANDELSQLIFWELSSKLGHVWLKCNWRKLSVTSKATELSSVKKTKFAKSFFNSSVVELLFRKSSTNCIVKTEIQVFIDLINLDKDNFGWLNFLVLYGLCLVLANIAS